MLISKRRLSNKTITLLAVLAMFGLTQNAFAEKPKLWLQYQGGIFGTMEITDGSKNPGTLIELVKDNPSALEVAEAARRHKIYGNVAMFGVYLPVSAATIYCIAKDKQTCAISGLLGMLGSLVATSYYQNRSFRESIKSMNIYNGIPEQQASKASSNFSIALMPVDSGATAGLGLEF